MRMPNPMDNAHFTSVAPSNSGGQNIFDVINKARQDPLGFEEMIKATNPEGYKRAMQIRNCANPRAMAIEMAKAQGIDPSILSMLGLH